MSLGFYPRKTTPEPSLVQAFIEIAQSERDTLSDQTASGYGRSFPWLESVSAYRA
ncbi:MAG: hypothetical protein ACOVS5_12630 [Oligoflexus sp.]